MFGLESGEELDHAFAALKNKLVVELDFLRKCDELLGVFVFTLFGV